MATVAETLEMAASLIEPDGAWTQGAGARDAEGNELCPGEESAAVCWCIGGALFHVTGRPVPFTPAFDALVDHLGEEPWRWNDHETRTQAEVVSALRAAAAKAREVRS